MEVQQADSVIEKEKIKLTQSFEMMKTDLEQCSQQVIQLSLDRSKFIRLSLLVWAAPLLIVAALLKEGYSPTFFEWNTYIRIVVGSSFFISSIIGCALLSALINNTNSANLAASGINYIRSTYFVHLSELSIINLDANIKKVLYLNDADQATFRIIHSDSAHLNFVFISVVNVLYGIVGLAILSKPIQVLIFSVMALILILIGHVFLYRKSYFKRLD